MSGDYKKLQNGSDIRGIALEGVEGEVVNLTQDVARRLSKGFLDWLLDRVGKSSKEMRIAVGRDPRLSGESLLCAVVEELSRHGVTIFDCGLASTPAMFMTTVFPEYRCDGAIMITASHLPFHRNGFKYFDKGGGLNKSDIAEILRRAEEEAGDFFPPETKKKDFESETGSVEKADLIGVYANFLREKIKKGVNHPVEFEKPLTGLKIAVDAGNGAGGFYADLVLAPLGADISGSCFLEPDGRFPNHAPNPEDETAMKAISKAVLKSKSDFGLIFDTDVDRSSAVDKAGRQINRNGIVAMAAALISEEHPGTTVVTDSVTSDQLTVYLEKKLGLHHHRFRRGYKNVINEAIRLNAEGIDSQLAIETSGHAALKENYFLDDGAYLATKIVIKAAKLHLEGKTLDSILEGLSEPEESVELRFPIRSDAFAAYADEVLEGLEEFVTKNTTGSMSLVTPNYEGVRISFAKESGDGWCLLRKSLHDPIMPLNIESNQKGGCTKMAEQLRSFLDQYKGLEISSLEKLSAK